MIRLLGHIAAVGVAAVLLLAMQRSTPSYVELTGPIPVRGRIGDTVEARRFDIAVDKVRFARRLRYRAFGRDYERDTGGVWAVVTARLAARRDSVTVMNAIWQGPSSIEYVASSRVERAPQALIGRRLEPGLPQRGLFIFEIPADQTGGATLVVSEARWPRLDSEARIAFAAVGQDALPGIADVLDLKALADE